MKRIRVPRRIVLKWLGAATISLLPWPIGAKAAEPFKKKFPTSGVVVGTTVTLSWTRAAEVPGGKYKIAIHKAFLKSGMSELRVLDQSDWEKYSTTGTSITIPNLEPFAIYWWQVRYYPPTGPYVVADSGTTWGTFVPIKSSWQALTGYPLYVGTWAGGHHFRLPASSLPPRNATNLYDVLTGNYLSTPDDVESRAKADIAAINALAAYHKGSDLPFKVRLHVHGILFKRDAAGAPVRLRDDYIQRWQRYAALIRPYASQIGMFYHVDEPFNYDNLITPTPETRELMLGYITAANFLIRDSFPQIPIAVSLDNGVIDPAFKTLNSATFPPLPGYDLLGTTYYTVFQGTSGGQWNQDRASLKATIAGVKAILRQGQKLLAVPQVNIDGASFEQAIPYRWELMRRMEEEAAIYLAEYDQQKLGAIMAFLWPSDNGKVLGLADIPYARERWSQMARGWLNASGAQIYPVAVSASSVDPTTTLGGIADDSEATSLVIPSYATPSQPQRVTLDFGRSQRIVRVTATVDQSPSPAYTEHVVRAGNTPEATTIVGQWKGTTSKGQVLNLNITPTNGRYLVIETRVSPSWVAWSTVSCYRQ